MNDFIEAVGFALVVGFLWFVWPPLVLLGAGLLLVLWANTRSRDGRVAASLAAAIGAARRAYAAAAAGEADKTADLRRVA